MGLKFKIDSKPPRLTDPAGIESRTSSLRGYERNHPSTDGTYELAANETSIYSDTFCISGYPDNCLDIIGLVIILCIYIITSQFALIIKIYDESLMCFRSTKEEITLGQNIFSMIA